MLFIQKKLKKLVKKSTFYIVGKTCCYRGSKKSFKRRVVRVFLTEDSKKQIHKENQHKILKNVTIFYKTKKELDKYCSREGITHQGMVAEIEHLDEISLKELHK